MNQDINVLINEYKKTGSTKVLDGILKLVRPLIFKTANSFHADCHTREDLVQQGYLIVMDSIRTYDQGKNMLYYGYLKKCLLYSCYRMLKAREIPCLNEPMDDGLEFLDTVRDSRMSIEDEIIGREVSSALCKAVNSLPKKQKHVILERFFNNRRLNDIAKDEGVVYMTAVMNQQLALKSLRRALRSFK